MTTNIMAWRCTHCKRSLEVGIWPPWKIIGRSPAGQVCSVCRFRVCSRCVSKSTPGEGGIICIACAARHEPGD